MEEQHNRRMSHCERLVGEKDLTIFGLEEVLDNQWIDVPRTFGPSGWGILISKMIAMGCCWFVLVMVLLQPQDTSPWTLWSSLVSCIYVTLSFGLSTSCLSPKPTQEAGALIKTVWALYSIAADAQLVGLVLYWFWEYNPNEATTNVSLAMLSHGGVCLLVFLDGALINRIPVRIYHWLFTLLFGLLCGGWTLMYNDDDDDDDRETYIKLGTAIFCFGPLFFLGIWFLSNTLKRRYISDQVKGRRPVVGKSSTNNGGHDIERPYLRFPVME